MIMLSRVAENLFWIGRYIERAENTARLLDTARRMAAIPGPGPDKHRSEWSSILASSGSDLSFPGDALNATRGDVIRHLALSQDNSSSIFSCFVQARRNARSTREGLPSDCWRILNDSYHEFKDLPSLHVTGRNLVEIIERTKFACMAIAGAVESTVLRNEIYDFIRLGTYTERFDSTARILDVKYFALLPTDETLEGGTDTYQWMTILDATSTRRVFRRVYGTDLRAGSVVELLIRHPECVRSLVFAVTRMQAHIAQITYGWQSEPCASLDRAHRLRALLTDQTTDEIIAGGLHEVLLSFIRENNALTEAISDDFNFIIPQTAPIGQEQSQSSL